MFFLRQYFRRETTHHCALEGLHTDGDESHFDQSGNVNRMVKLAKETCVHQRQGLWQKLKIEWFLAVSSSFSNVCAGGSVEIRRASMVLLHFGGPVIRKQ